MSKLEDINGGTWELDAPMSIALSRCQSLTTLPEGLGKLACLTIFDLSEFWSLTTLPEGLGNLNSLTTLFLSECRSLTTSPKELRNLIFFDDIGLL